MQFNTLAADCENTLESAARKACFTEDIQVASDGKRDCRADRNARKSACDTIGRPAYTGWDELAFLSEVDGVMCKIVVERDRVEPHPWH